MRKLLVICVIFTVMAGCASIGRPIDQAAVDKIKIGETTKDEVLSLIGSPDSITEMGRGQAYWHYRYSRVALGYRQHQRVIIAFGPDNIVKNILRNQGGTEIRKGVQTGERVDMPDVEENKRPK